MKLASALPRRGKGVSCFAVPLGTKAPRQKCLHGNGRIFFADFLLGGIKRKSVGVRGEAPAVWPEENRSAALR